MKYTRKELTENKRKLVQRKREPSKTYTLPLEDLSIRGPFYLNVQVYINKPKNIQKADIVTFFPKNFASELPGTHVILEDSKGFNQSLHMKIHHPWPWLHPFIASTRVSPTIVLQVPVSSHSSHGGSTKNRWIFSCS